MTPAPPGDGAPAPVDDAPAPVVPTAPARPRATSSPAWPGLDPLVAARAVLGELGGDDGLPFLPELAARGPGADPVGRTAGLLVEMPVDLQPVGWRLVDRPGRDLRRALSFRTADTDALAEAADGYAGPLVLGSLGPWTLAASVWLPRGERAAVDAGAARDLAESLTAGIAEHVRAVRREVPGADVVVLLDEPSLPAVLEGRVPTASGWGRLTPVEGVRAREALRGVVEGVAAAGARTVLRCAAPRAPLALLRDAGAAGLAVDVRQLGSAAWEALAGAVELGQQPWLGVLDPLPATAGPAGPARPAGAPLPAATALAASLRRSWADVGLEVERLAAAVLAPTAGLAGLPPAGALAVLSRLREAARATEEVALSG